MNEHSEHSENHEHREHYERGEQDRRRRDAERREDARRAAEAAEAAETAEERRRETRPFTYPYEERRANVRATRRIGREEADADMTPGVPGGQGATGGGQPGGTGVGVPPGAGTTPDERADTVGWADPAGEDAADPDEGEAGGR